MTWFIQKLSLNQRVCHLVSTHCSVKWITIIQPHLFLFAILQVAIFSSYLASSLNFPLPLVSTLDSQNFSYPTSTVSFFGCPISPFLHHCTVWSNWHQLYVPCSHPLLPVCTFRYNGISCFIITAKCLYSLNQDVYHNLFIVIYIIFLLWFLSLSSLGSNSPCCSLVVWTYSVCQSVVIGIISFVILT